MTILKGLGIFFGVVLFIFLMSFIGNSIGLFNIRFWGVKKENAKREVFEQTQSYVEGKRQELLKLYREYNQAESQEEKQAIKVVVQQSFANVEDSKFEEPLYSFVREMKYY